LDRVKTNPDIQRLEPLGLHRTLLFLLVVGLIIAAFRNADDGLFPAGPRQHGPGVQESLPGAPSATNVAAGRGLASVAGESAP